MKLSKTITILKAIDTLIREKHEFIPEIMAVAFCDDKGSVHVIDPETNTPVSVSVIIFNDVIGGKKHYDGCNIEVCPTSIENLIKARMKINQ